MAAPHLFNRERYKIRRGQRRVAPGFLHEECGARVLDRLDDIKRTFAKVAVLAGDDGAFAGNLRQHPAIGELVRINDRADHQSDIIADLDALPLPANHFDAVISSFALHWVNDLPGFLIQAKSMLKPDGLLLIGMPGGNSLHELRTALMQAEMNVSQGAAVRVPPFVDVRDAGALLQRAGFGLPVSDFDRLTVKYRDLMTLFQDLRGMGETNPMADAQPRLSPAVLMQMVELYQSQFGQDGHWPATFDLIFMTGWKPAASQPQALKPGSAQSRLIDALTPPEMKTPPGAKPPAGGDQNK